VNALAPNGGFSLRLLPPAGDERRFLLDIPAGALDAAIGPRLRDLLSGPATAAHAARLRDGLVAEYARAVAQDAAGALLRQAGLRAAAPLRVELLPPPAEGGLRLRLAVPLAPRVPPPRLDGLPPPVAAPPAPTAAAVRAALEELARRHAPGRAAPPGHAAMPGDSVVFDMLAQPLRPADNLLRNPRGLGNPAPGRVPTHWSVSYVREGLACFVGRGEEDGLPCVDLRYAGTISPTQSPQVAPERPGQVAVLPGQVVRVQGAWRLLFGVLPPGTRASLLLEQRDAAGQVVQRPAQPLPCPGPGPLGEQRFALDFAVRDPAARSVLPVLRLRPPDEAAVALTLRLGGLQLTLGEAAPLPGAPLAMPGLSQRLGGAGDADAIPGLAPLLAFRRKGEGFTLVAPLRGQDHRLAVMLRAVRRPGAVGDALARRLGHADLAALRRAVAAELGAAAAERLRLERRRALLRVLLPRLAAAPPEAWVDRHHAALRGALEVRIQAGRLEPEEQAADPAALRAALRPEARRRAAADLLADTLRAPGDPPPDPAPGLPPEARHAGLWDRLLGVTPRG